MSALAIASTNNRFLDTLDLELDHSELFNVNCKLSDGDIFDKILSNSLGNDSAQYGSDSSKETETDDEYDGGSDTSSSDTSLQENLDLFPNYTTPPCTPPSPHHHINKASQNNKEQQTSNDNNNNNNNNSSSSSSSNDNSNSNNSGNRKKGKCRPFYSQSTTASSSSSCSAGKKTKGKGPKIRTQKKLLAEITDRERDLLQPYVVPKSTPFSKDVEKTLRAKLRAIRNKDSAIRSRKKKEEYVKTLELKLKTIEAFYENIFKKAERLESENAMLRKQLEEANQKLEQQKDSSPILISDSFDMKESHDTHEESPLLTVIQSEDSEVVDIDMDVNMLQLPIPAENLNADFNLDLIDINQDILPKLHIPLPELHNATVSNSINSAKSGSGILMMAILCCGLQLGPTNSTKSRYSAHENASVKSFRSRTLRSIPETYETSWMEFFHMNSFTMLACLMVTVAILAVFLWKNRSKVFQKTRNESIPK